MTRLIKRTPTRQIAAAKLQYEILGALLMEKVATVEAAGMSAIADKRLGRVHK